MKLIFALIFILMVITIMYMSHQTAVQSWDLNRWLCLALEQNYFDTGILADKPFVK